MFSTLTDEQLSIQRNCAAIATVPSMRMRVIARAGTGKTTTMEAVVMKIKEEAGPQPLICYTAFNKTTETEFGERIRKKTLANNLPFKDIESRTLHSLCYSWFIGTRGGEFLRDMKDSIETEPVVKYFQLEKLIGERYGASTANVYTPVSSTTAGRGGLNRSKQQRVKYEAIMLGEMILKTLENFLNSAAAEISDKHLPYQITNRFKEWTDKMDTYLIKKNCLKITAAEFYRKFDFINRAAALYKESLSHNEAVGMNVTHSVYQKYTQLSGAVLTSRQGRMFNVFLIDEAQDLNECQCAIIHRQYQQGSTIALVGDPAQSIYQFRGACRQFERWEVDAEETLTLSFRFGRSIARLCNIMLGMEKLWLHSLRESITPAALPLSVKKEMKTEEMCADMTQFYIQAGSTQSTSSCASTGNVAALSTSAPPQPIQALVRGLHDVQDKWVPLNTVLEYPFTVICRTNNNTYFALLECIQESVRQARQTAIVATIPDTPDGEDSLNAVSGINNIAEGSSRKRPWEETYTGSSTNNSSSSDWNANNNASNARGGGMFDLASLSTTTKPPLYSQVTTPYTHHTSIPKPMNSTAPGGASHNTPNNSSGSFVTPVFARTGTGGMNSHIHTDSVTSNGPNYHPTTPYDALTPMNNSTQAGPVQVLPHPPTTVNTTRRFYVNGIKSYAQLENNLVRRIEQLSQISLQKPFLYKGEHYTDLDALRDVSTEMEDITLRELIDITKKWGSDLENIKTLIRTHYASTPAEADVFVTTVHKSKGLEWDRVALGIDIGAPLQAQPLFVVAFRCKQDSVPPLSSGSNSTDARSSSDENTEDKEEKQADFTHFAVCLEKTREAAFAAINFWLQVGQPASTNVPPLTDAGSEEARNPSGADGVYVKKEPGLAGLKKGITNSSMSHTNADVIDLCDDEEQEGDQGEEWICSRCASSNPPSEKSCDTCYASRHPAGRIDKNSSLYGKINNNTVPAKVNPFLADRQAERTQSSYPDSYGTAPNESQPASLPHPAGSAGSIFKPSRDCNIVPLLPSTVALGYQMLRAPLGGDSSGASSSSNNGNANRYSKCQLLCLNTTHLPCRARVACMFQHEVAERKRQFGRTNVCVITINGDGPQNYQLDFNDTVACDETEANTMREFARYGGNVPRMAPSTVYAQGNQYIAQHHAAPTGTQQSQLGIMLATPAKQITQATQGSHPVIKAETSSTQSAPINTPSSTNNNHNHPNAVCVPRFDPFAIKFSNRQNANEWYVAVSRAKRTLRVNVELAQILEWIERDIGGLRTALKMVIGAEAEEIRREED